jgi:hypothetical protein
MAVALYLDVHVPQAVADQLRRRRIDVLTAVEDTRATEPDDYLLLRATELNRVIVTFDVRFKAMAEDWIRMGREFFGLAYAHPLRISIGQLVSDLEMISLASDIADWRSKVEYLPL